MKCDAGTVLFSVLPEQMFSRLKLTTDKFRSKPLNSVISVNFKMNSTCYGLKPSYARIKMACHPHQEEYKDNESDFEEKSSDICYKYH